MAVGGQRVLPQMVGRPLVLTATTTAKTSSAMHLPACMVPQPRADVLVPVPPAPLPSSQAPAASRGPRPASLTPRRPPISDLSSSLGHSNLELGI